MIHLFLSLWARKLTYIPLLLGAVLTAVSLLFLSPFGIHEEAYEAYGKIEEPYVILSYRQDIAGENYLYAGQESPAYLSYDGTTFSESLGTRDILMAEDGEIPTFTTPVEGSFPLASGEAAVSLSLAERFGLEIGQTLYLSDNRTPISFQISAFCEDFYGFTSYQPDPNPGFVILGYDERLSSFDVPILSFSSDLVEDEFTRDEVYDLASFKEAAFANMVSNGVFASLLIVVPFLLSVFFDLGLYRRAVPLYFVYGYRRVGALAFAVFENLLLVVPAFLVLLASYLLGSLCGPGLVLGLVLLGGAYLLRLSISVALSMRRKKQ